MEECSFTQVLHIRAGTHCYLTLPLLYFKEENMVLITIVLHTFYSDGN